ncbi:MAG: DUF481 domain-containing protein [Planctomycetota bacterium]|jgi:putative salt-induced outer membrane protein
MLRHITLAVCLLGATMAARADELQLTSGETLKGTLVERTDDAVVFEHAVLGVLTVKNANVANVRVEGEPTTDVEPTKDLEAEKAEAAKKMKEQEWKSVLEIGFAGAEGNSDNANAHVGVASEKKDEEGQTKVDAKFTWAESEGEETTNRVTAGAFRDWNMGDSEWTLFTAARYDRDRFTEWDQRGSLAAGAGRTIYKTDVRELTGRLGASATKEWGGSDDDHVRPEGLVNVSYEWKINENQTFTARSTYFPDLSDGPEYRLVSGADWTIKVDSVSGMSLKFGVEHELDTHRMDPFKRQDLRYFGLLIYAF